MAPDFLLIGAQKGGTSSVFLNLLYHPNILVPLNKEIFYFNEHFDQSENWYLSHFPPEMARKRLEKRRGQRCITGEGSITYLCDAVVPERVKQHFPSVKLLAVLRDPALRAHSHFKHAIRLKNETRDFATAIRVEMDRIARGILQYEDPDTPYNENTQYLVRGHYADQLENWFKFFPREQMLILRSEDFFENPGVVYGEILDFLDLPQWAPGKFASINIARNRVPFGQAERDLLADYFRPHNRKLNELLGRDFGWDAA